MIDMRARRNPRAQRYVTIVLTVAASSFLARRVESNRFGLGLPDLAIFLVLDDITIGGCFYQSDERVRFTLLFSLPSLSLLFLRLLLSLPASRARREKKMRGSRSFIPRRMLRRNYHAA